MLSRAAQSEGDLPETLSGTNPLVAAANPLLNLIPQLRAIVQNADPAQIRAFLVQQIQAFETRAQAMGIGSETVIGARYCLCTALDETAAQTPWGGSGVWSRHSLLVTFYNETWGGEKFFQLLAKLAQNPQQHGDLLELMYYCLALGFEGRFRIVDNGRALLETLKQRLLQILTKLRGEHERPLALHWQPSTATARKSWELLPLWVTAAFTALIGLLLYLWFAFSLSAESDGLFAAIHAIRAPKIAIARAPAPAPAPRFAKFLEPEVREGLVTVSDESDRSVITLRGDGLFDPGSTVIKDRYLPVLNRIADALNGVVGSVLVNGYTDATPIRTMRFPSNWHLSQERADVVKKLLEQRLTTPNRIRSEGRAESDPVAPNDTPENRARNRRVVVTLLVAPTDRDGPSTSPGSSATPVPGAAPPPAPPPASKSPGPK
ncbi:MAG: DotU family type VI secretion system protein [Casimicrobiaceae bacterium]